MLLFICLAAVAFVQPSDFRILLHQRNSELDLLVDSAHLQANIENEVDPAKRHFATLDIEQSTGKITNTEFNRIIRANTYTDTESKLFQSLEEMWYNSKNKIIFIFSERGICNRCKSVAQQFIDKHSEAKVNIVSEKQATESPWKGRKIYD